MEDSFGSAAALGGILAGTIMTIMMASLVFFVLLVIAHWKMFTKAGEAGWKSIIPIYSDYVLFKLVWDVRNFLITIGLGILTYVSMMLSGGFSVDEYGQPTINGGNVFFLILAMIFGIAAFVWAIRLQLKTAKAYGQGVGFAIGLILLPNIFTLILGFGSAQYVGPQIDDFDRKLGSN